MNQHVPELIGTGKPGVVIQTPAENADETGAIPQNAALSNTENCQQCDKPFIPRHGGKPQLFCSETCRMAFHSEAREADKTTLASLRERGTLPIPPAATMTHELPPVATGDDAFDWADDESVVLREQPMTAAYFNRNGELVIRQARWPDDDVFIYIAQNNLADFLDKITDIGGVPSVGRA